MKQVDKLNHIHNRLFAFQKESEADRKDRVEILKGQYAEFAMDNWHSETVQVAKRAKALKEMINKDIKNLRVLNGDTESELLEMNEEYKGMLNVVQQASKLGMDTKSMDADLADMRKKMNEVKDLLNESNTTIAGI